MTAITVVGNSTIFKSDFSDWATGMGEHIHPVDAVSRESGSQHIVSNDLNIFNFINSRFFGIGELVVRSSVFNELFHPRSGIFNQAGDMFSEVF